MSAFTPALGGLWGALANQPRLQGGHKGRP